MVNSDDWFRLNSDDRVGCAQSFIRRGKLTINWALRRQCDISGRKYSFRGSSRGQSPLPTDKNHCTWEVLLRTRPSLHATVHRDLYRRMQQMPCNIPLAGRVWGRTTEYDQLTFAGSRDGSRRPSSHPRMGIDTCRQILEWDLACLFSLIPRWE